MKFSVFAVVKFNFFLEFRVGFVYDTPYDRGGKGLDKKALVCYK